jgi:hypothetical protein
VTGQHRSVPSFAHLHLKLCKTMNQVCYCYATQLIDFRITLTSLE